MSRLDHQILTVRNKLMLGVFLETLAFAGILLGIVVSLAIIVERIFNRQLSHSGLLLLMGAIVAGITAFIFSLTKRPSAELTAMKIDEVLGLKEKFSTALFVRPNSGDEFARAAVLDAEMTAQNVSIHNRFPLEFPRQAMLTAAIFAVAVLLAIFFPTFHVFEKSTASQNKLASTGPKPQSQTFMKQELPKILAAAVLPNAGEAIKKATADLDKAVHTDEGDELKNHRSVLSALQNYNKAMTDELDKNEQFQTAQDEKNQMSAIASAKDDSTPIGKAQNEIRAGDLDSAMNDISKAVKDFDKAKPEDQSKMIDQAKNLANELAKAGNDPKVGEHLAQQLMQMGATQSQAQQMSAAMQQAAQGNQQAQQQLQQMAQKMTQQMNGGQGPTQQQQSQIQSLMAKAQGLANSQAQAQALSGVAQQLANSMAQAQAQAQAQSGAPKGSQPAGGHQGQGQSAQAQGQPQQGSSPGQQPGQGQGQQGQQSQGQSQGQGQGQGMGSAQSQMQQQLQNMQASAKDAQAMQQAASAAADAAADSAAGLGPGNQSGSGNDPGQGQGQGQSQQPGGQQQANGGGGGGLGKGGAKMPIAVAPYTFKQELDPSRDTGTGKILASRYVKAGIDKGNSIAGAKDVALSAQKDETDDIEQDRIPREAQQAEKDYFSSMQDDGGH